MTGSRRLRIASTLTGALLLGATTVRAEEESGGELSPLQRAALGDDSAWALVESLVTEVGPRFAGTSGDAAAVAWAEAKLRALGFPKVWTEAVTVPRWVRGGASGHVVTPWPHEVRLLALGGGAGTGDGGIEAEVVGVAGLAELEALPDEAVSGRIVFLSQRMERTGSDWRGYAEAVPIRTQGPALAASKGAVAALIRSVGTDSNRLPHTGGTRFPEGVAPIPAAALSAPDADLLERLLARRGPVRFRLELGCRFEGEAESANVFAEIPGATHPDEVVLLTAHLDSWDVGRGAQDNGTGVAIVIEAARLTGLEGGRAPRRTLRVLLTANEEFGLSGARAYASARGDEVASHVLGLEADSGAGAPLGFRVRFAPGDPDAAVELAARLAPLGLPRLSGEARGGADLGPLVPRGLPLVDVDLDRSAYFDVHHTDNDTLDKIDPENLRRIVAAYATAAEWAANRERRLTPVPAPDPEDRP
jgi:carboxypeptidase Q